MEHKEYEHIWLEPSCAESSYGCEGRQWCQDNVWGEKCSDCDAVPVKFIRADIVERLEKALRRCNEAATEAGNDERHTAGERAGARMVGAIIRTEMAALEYRPAQMKGRE
jgi:hypothetical protein